MGFTNIVSLLTGVALFLFGMLLMGEGLKKIAGNKLEIFLYKLTGNRVKGALFGAGITTIMHSSSATSVMVVGFVNSGLMKVKQAVPIVLGSVFGSSITGWIFCLSQLEGAGGIAVVFSTTTLAGISAITGIILRMFSKKQYNNRVGDVLLGFCVLMSGMAAMSGSVSVLKESEGFTELVTKFSNPFLGILMGIGFACILQSATAAVGILQALTVTGIITFAGTLPLLMGISIGAALPVLLSSIGGTRAGKQTAISYLISNTLGVLITAPVYYLINYFVKLPMESTVLNTVDVAMINTIYRLIVVIILLPLSSKIENLSKVIIPDKKADEVAKDMVLLDDRFLTHTTLALEKSKEAIKDMAFRAKENFMLAKEIKGQYLQESFEIITNQEEVIDDYEDRLGTFLLKLNSSKLDQLQNENISKYLHTISDFERIGDHAMNLAQMGRNIWEKGIEFSEDAIKEMMVLESALEEILEMSIKAFNTDNINLAKKVEPLEEVIDCLCDQIKLNHIKRMCEGRCSYESGFIFNDIITGYERIADHCSNIAVAMLSIKKDSFATHAYIYETKRDNQKFADEFKEYNEKYKISSL